MEMVVVVLIFVITMMATVNIFITTQRTQRKSAAMQKLQDDLRFVLNRIGNEARVDTIDYAQYDTINGAGLGAKVAGEDYLALRDFEGKQVVITTNKAAAVVSGDLCKNGAATCPPASDGTASTSCVVIGIDGVCAAATSSNISLDTLKFFIVPNTSAGSTTRQSAVRIVLDASSVIVGNSPTHVQMQTTISSRQYLH